MKKGTVLTDEQINAIWRINLTGLWMSGDSIRQFARAIEQAIEQAELEAKQMQELIRLMPEVLASLKNSGVDVSLAAEVERALEGVYKFGEEGWVYGVKL